MSASMSSRASAISRANFCCCVSICLENLPREATYVDKWVFLVLDRLYVFDIDRYTSFQTFHFKKQTKNEYQLNNLFTGEFELGAVDLFTR